MDEVFDVKSECAKHGPESVDLLASIVKKAKIAANQGDNIPLLNVGAKAAGMLLDRAFGTPVSEVKHSGEVASKNTFDASGLDDAVLRAIVAAREKKNAE